MSSFVVAIDGPAASGKGTISRRLAKEFGFHHLDTGLTYRAVAKALLDQGLPLDDVAVAESVAKDLDLSNLDPSVLAVHEVGNAASKVAVMPSVRKILVQAQQSFALKSPGTILDGRDIGTVVCPDANVKIFVIADAQTRAKRRYDEAVSKGRDLDFQQVLEDILARDARDMGRKDSPMRQANDALLLDTSKMDIETAFYEASAMVKAKME
tara:strand:- start:3504 stop:4136 length:633 start_codon:yes stop_codon:yes gene_type:complete